MNLQPKQLQRSARPIELHELMEISGVDPELTICKIAVLPIKLYPLKKVSEEGLEPSRLEVYKA